MSEEHSGTAPTPEGLRYARDLLAEYVQSLPDEVLDCFPLPERSPSDALLMEVLMVEGGIRTERRDQGWGRREMRRIFHEWCEQAPP